MNQESQKDEVKCMFSKEMDVQMMIPPLFKKGSCCGCACN